MAASMEALGMFFARHCSTTLASWALSAGSGPPSVVKGGTVGIMGGGGLERPSPNPRGSGGGGGVGGTVRSWGSREGLWGGRTSGILENPQENLGG